MMSPRFDAVASIQFSGDETYSIVYEEGSDNTYCADDVYFAQIGGEMLPLDNRTRAELSGQHNRRGSDGLCHL